jgi:ADP-ribosylglycohydrolase
MLGAWLGAHLGIDAIPRDWRSKLTAESRISAALDRILLDESR